MQLYKQISELNYETTKLSDIKKILKELGIEQEFMWVDKINLVEFLFYFVHAYSFESTMMDTKSFTNSLSVIESAFKFDLSNLKEVVGDTFESKYQELVQWYLEVQKNRDFELLMSGMILYKQMISASTSETILKKSKGEDATENIDYDLKHKIYMNCISLNKELSALEETLSKSNSLINLVQESKVKKVFDTKIETL